MHECPFHKTFQLKQQIQLQESALSHVAWFAATDGAVELRVESSATDEHWSFSAFLAATLFELSLLCQSK